MEDRPIVFCVESDSQSCIFEECSLWMNCIMNEDSKAYKNWKRKEKKEIE